MPSSPVSRKDRRSTLWEATAAAGPKLNSIQGCHEAEFAVIGGGIAGLSTTLHLAAAGCDVIAVEANEVGGGATGESGGLVAPDFVRHTPAEVGHLLNREWGTRLVDMVGSCASQCFKLISDYGISCAAKQDGFWVPAHSKGVLLKLREQAKQWKEAGFNVECIPASETIRSLGTSSYCGAIRFADGGSLNPLAFSRGLAEAAIREGAVIFANSPVKQIIRSGGRWTVISGKGQVNARCIVLAANGGNASLHPQMKRTVLPLKVFEYATAPLSAKQRAEILPDGGSFTDKQPYIFTARYDDDGRLIAAIPDFSINRSQNCLLEEASRRLLGHFPILKDVSIDYLWRGTAWLNTSLLPKVYDLNEGAFAIQACNGRGIATNAVLGKELAAALIEKDERLLSVQLERPTSIRAHWAVKMVPSILMGLAFIKNRFGGSK